MFGVRKIINIIFSDDNKKDEVNKKDEIKKIMINILNSLVGILLVLIILLLGTMLGLEFEYGIFDINIMISVMPTLLGGYLGFLGAIVGVIGAYLILKKQLSDENKKSKDKEVLEIKMMKCLLEYTISETDYIVCWICEKYSDMYNEYLGEEVLKSKFKSFGNNVSVMMNHLLSDNPKEDDLTILEQIYTDKKFIEKVRDKYKNYNPYRSTFKEIYNIFNDINDYKLLVYDKKWDSYLISIKNSGNFEYEDIQNIINWIGTLNNNIVRKNIEKINELEEEIQIKSIRMHANDPVIKQLVNKLMRLEKEVLNHITKFIDERDIIISLVNNKEKFGEEILSWEFDYSYDMMMDSILLTERIHNIVK